MTEEELATVQANAQKIRNMIEEVALAGSGDPFHSNVYLNVHDSGVVTVIGGSPGGVANSYGSYSSEHLGEITSEIDDGAQAVVEVADFVTYGLDFASDGGELQFALRGDPDSELASAIEFYGAVNSRIMTDVAGDILEKVPTGIVDAFPEGDGQYVSPQKGEPFPANIRTQAAHIERLIEVVDHDPETKLFPITVDDGELKLDVGRDGGRNAVWGDLAADSVEGPDVSNQYKKGFTEAFSALSGDVWLQTVPDGPLCVAQEREGAVVRHVIGPMSSK